MAVNVGCIIIRNYSICFADIDLFRGQIIDYII